MAKTSVALCIVIHNEGLVLERCLRSVPSWISERYVVHDGPCTDDSLNIAKKYKCKTYIRPFIGIAEPHRAWIYQKARSSWILQLDGDEFLSKSLQKELLTLIYVENIDCYETSWPVWEKGIYITKQWPTKKFLFRKEGIRFLGSPQEEVKVSKDRIRRIEVRLEHRPTYINFSFVSFMKKGIPWIKVHARYLTFKKDIPSFPKNLQEHPTFYAIAQYPFVGIGLVPYIFAANMLSGGLQEGLPGLRVCFFVALYYTAVFGYAGIYRLKDLSGRFIHL